MVIAGEDRNDRRSLRILLEAFCSPMRGRIVEISDPARLRDATSAATLARRVDVLAKKVRARAAREDASLACVFVHEDLDRPDGPEYFATRKRVQSALVDVFGAAHYVLPVAEMEAWLLLFPDALSGTVSSWQVPQQYRDRDTGVFTDPKEILRHRVTSQTRRYRESDAPEVFNKAVLLGSVNTPVGTNRSFDHLKEAAAQCCQQHLRKG